MLVCAAKSCDRPAARGEAWTGAHLGEIEQYRRGIRLRLSVKDIGVRLVLCDEHARELTAAAWGPVLSMLDGWGWHSPRGMTS